MNQPVNAQSAETHPPWPRKRLPARNTSKSDQKTPAGDREPLRLPISSGDTKAGRGDFRGSTHQPQGRGSRCPAQAPHSRLRDGWREGEGEEG